MATWQLTNKGFSLDLAHSIDYWQFNVDFMDGSVEGRLQWNSEDGTLEYGLPGGNVTLQIGQEQLVKCVNNTGSTIEDGDVVYVSGAAGSRPEISLASSATGTGNVPIGMATEDIEHLAQGYVNIGGLVRGIDTSGIAAGSVGFLSDTVPGALRATPPDAPNYTTVVGYCLFSDADVGIFLVRVLSAPRLVSLSDTLAGDPDDGDVYKWVEANDRFELAALPAGGGDLLADGSVPMTADWPFGDFSLLIGDDANTKMTVGLTINQGANDDEILALKSSDVGHGLTDDIEADTFGTFRKIAAADGGLYISGITEGAYGLFLEGVVATNDTTKSTSTLPAVVVYASKIVGGSRGNVAANSACLGVRVRTGDTYRTQWLVDDGGDTWQAGSLFINEPTNAKMTLGITINQGAATDEILTLKHSAVSHGATSITESDTFAMYKNAGGGAHGGVIRMSFSSSAYPVIEDVFQTTSSTGLTTAAIAAYQIRAQKIGGGGRANLDPDTNIFCIRARLGGTFVTVFIVDEDGDTWMNGDLVLGTTRLSETDLTDLTDGGATTLHSHAAGGGDLKADGSVPMSANWPFGNHILFIGDTSNSKMTVGLTINQGGNHDEALALKSSNVAHGRTGLTETDTYGFLGKDNAGGGGLIIRGFRDAGGPNDAALTLAANLMEDVNSTKGASGLGMINFYLAQISGNADADIVANGNLLCIRGRKDGSYATQWQVDVEGFTWQSGSIFVNEIANTKMTLGLTINQGANDDEIVALKSSDVDHDMTSLTETDTFGTVSKYLAADGGLHFCGYSDSICGLRLSGRAMTEDSGPDGGQVPTVLISCQKTNGAGSVTTQGDDACLMAVKNHTANKWQVQGDGRTFQSGGLFINEFTNIHNNLGLTVNQGTWDNECISLKSTDVDHAYTDFTEADTYGVFQKNDPATGGLYIAGQGSDNLGLSFSGYIETINEVILTIPGYAAIRLIGRLASGSGVTTLDDTATLVSMINNSQPVWQVQGNGATHQGGGGTFGAKCIGVNGETIPEVDIDDAAPGTTYPGLIWVDTS